MNQRYLLALAVAWVAIALVRKLLPFLLGRGFGRIAATAVGKQALNRVPQHLTLLKTEFPAWTQAAEVEQQAAPLRQEGFTDLGAYSVSTIPGVLIRMLAHPTTFVAAHIYDYPRAGNWVEFVTRYTDGSSHTLTTLPPTGMDHPAWVRMIQADKSIPTGELYRQFLTQREWHNIKPVAPQDAIREFEENYAKLMAWRQQNGVSPKEVAQVARGWLKKKQAAGANH